MAVPATPKALQREGGRSPPSSGPGARLLLLSTLRQAWSRELPETAKCVQVVDVQCVLQFTSLLAAGCALHRRTSRVIHRSELLVFL